MILQIILSFIGTVAFAVLFQAPYNKFVYCGISGAVAWVVYLLAHQYLSHGMSIFISALMLTILTRCFSFRLKAPVTIFLVTGIFPLVPGTGIYFTAYYLFMADSNMAFMKGWETLSTAGAIALGILFGSAIPPQWFRAVLKK